MATDANTVSVYVCRNRRGKICFVGSTRDLERRGAEHAVRGWAIEHVLDADADSARNVEQAVIDRLGRKNA